VSQANSEQQQFWDRRAPAWEKRADSLDSIADSYGVPVMEALGLEPGQRVVDIGCGPGSTSIQLARRIGNQGEVVGVDISSGMVAAAGRRASAAGLTNVRFLVADAQTDPLGQDFDAAFSRFGVMFFGDPVAAFANIGRSMKPGGCLACAVWGPLADNPWMFVPTLAAVQVLSTELALPEPGRPGPFSLDHADLVHEVLTAAGFVDTDVGRIDGSRHVTSEAAGDNVTTLLAVGPLGEAYEAADEHTRDLAVEAVVSALEPYRHDEGWDLPGVALKVTARRG
jgi:SAM-dependent methyltransferase